ncbi:Vps9p/ RAB5 like RAB GTpase binding protein involved in vacuolar sorting [Cryptosporidium ryanae]|uniref:Vps9p/ RAB5 like RAB GTpase binding protein involved in vacuolar sorting n=1 Tax=Cryptosporidium ryanae TaxID=515981 RepID=UPI00351A90D9|nr:Vps9p/ RAB5 like RAB GTpase binding protein involved in vacuolar sorting [Cryptosporidium ryanae]
MKQYGSAESAIESSCDLSRVEFDGFETNESPDLAMEKYITSTTGENAVRNKKITVATDTNEELSSVGVGLEKEKNNEAVKENQNENNMSSYNKFLLLLKNDKCNETVFFISKFIQQYPYLDDGLLHVIYGEVSEKHELEDIIVKHDDINTKTLSYILHSFVSFCVRLLLETNTFRSVPSIEFEEERDKEEVVFITEGLEKLITTKLYNILFEAVSFENDDADHYLFRKLKVLKTFVKLHHFDISKMYIEMLQTDNLWLDICKNELHKFIRVKSPKDKVVLIVNICKILLSYMNNINKKWKESNANLNEDVIDSPPAADDLLPLLIYCLIQSNPTKIKAHIEFISLFRNSNLLVSEDLYFFTHFYSAITFLEKLDGRKIQLNIESSVFEERFNSSEKKLFGNNLLNLLTPYSESKFRFEEKQKEIEEILSEISQLKLSYTEFNSIEELKVGDMPKLFEEYKSMANLIKDLKKG